MDASILQAAGSLGVGALLGIVIFLMYRQDRNATDKRMEDMYVSSHTRLASMIERDQKTREEHTRVLTELITWLKRANGR